MIYFPKGASDYYKVKEAREFLESPVPAGYVRWRCKLCGYPQGDFLASHPKYDMLGAICCGGCGMTCCRPINEWKDENPWNENETEEKKKESVK